MARFTYSWPGWLLLSAYALVGMSASHADPSIQILSVPTYGSSGELQGVATGVDAQAYDVATYFHVEGTGWWTEPNVAMRTVPLNANGTFSLPIVSNGLDAKATIFATALVPKGYTPPAAAASGRIPAALTSVAIDYRQRYSRTLEFGGYQWGVKESLGGAGPGSNRFSNSPQDIWVDNQGLHLSVNKYDNDWWATEAINTKPLGYGTYIVQTNSRVGEIDPMVAFGAFTWDAFGDDTVGPSPNRELDFEDARFGFAGDVNTSQFVVQPFDTPGQLVRYRVPDPGADPALTRILVWTPESIRFLALQGHHTITDFAPKDVIAEWLYTGSIPDPGRAAFRFNLWPANLLLGGTVPEPLNGQAQSVIVSDFFFTPVPEASCWISLGAGLAALLVWTAYRRGDVQSRRAR